MSDTPSRGSLLSRVPFFYGWIVVLVAFVTMGVGVNARSAFSLLFPPILDEFGWTRGDTAAAFAFGFLVSSFLSPFLGAAIDRFGPRLVFPAGAVIVTIGLLATTFSSEPWQLSLTLGIMVVGGLFGSKTFVWSLVLSLSPLFVPYLAVRVEFFWPLWTGVVAHYFASFLDRRARIV